MLNVGFQKIALGIFAALVAFSCHAKAQEGCEQFFADAPAKSQPERARLRTLKLAPGRQLTFDYLPPQSGRPTLLMMPGVNRGFSANDVLLKNLNRTLGFGIAAFNFSTHPLSVSRLKKGETPYFNDQIVTSEMLARETEVLATHLRKLGAGEIVPVSLSYSGSVSPYLKGFNHIIDTVPLTETDAAVSAQARQAETFLDFQAMLFPGFGGWFARSQKDAAYRSQWTSQVDSLLKSDEYNIERRNDMIEGYIRQSQAIEGFKWNTEKLDPHVRRTFILAGGENPTLLDSQIKTFEKIAEKDQEASLFLIMNSSHTVFNDQPAAYSTSLGAALNAENPNIPRSAIWIIVPGPNGKTLDVELIARENFKEFFNDYRGVLRKKGGRP